jgi:hypothetical protein
MKRLVVLVLLAGCGRVASSPEKSETPTVKAVSASGRVRGPGLVMDVRLGLPVSAQK